jgi:hypothetical protein
MTVGPQETTLAPRGARVLAVLVVAICVAVEVSLVVYGHVDVTLRATPWVAFAGVGAYCLFWAPLVRLSPAEIEIVNPLRTHRISWPAVEDVETRFSLAVRTRRGRVTIWAAPAPGPWSSVSQLRRDPLGRASLGSQQRRLPTTVAALAPALVMRQWESYRESGVLHGASGAGESSRWHRVLIAILATCAVLGVVAALVVP